MASRIWLHSTTWVGFSVLPSRVRLTYGLLSLTRLSLPTFALFSFRSRRSYVSGVSLDFVQDAAKSRVALGLGRSAFFCPLYHHHGNLIASPIGLDFKLTRAMALHMTSTWLVTWWGPNDMCTFVSQDDLTGTVLVTSLCRPKTIQHSMITNALGFRVNQIVPRNRSEGPVQPPAAK